jgi:probable HAF family extracellular repeat protein
MRNLLLCVAFPMRNTFMPLAAALALCLAAAPARADYIFTSFDAPGVTNGTTANAINDSGAIVGVYPGHGYLLTPGGGFTTLTFPGVVINGADGITASGAIVGGYSIPGVSEIGFLLSGGTFTNIFVPGSTLTGPGSVSPSGTIVGIYDTPLRRFSFLYKDGVYTTLPFGPNFVPQGINDQGQIVGSNSGTGPGFLLDPNGNSTTINFPGALNTFANGINNLGDIVGYYYDGRTTHGFLMDPAGNFTSFDVPEASPPGTLPFAINDAGEIVGFYWDANGFNHAFIATPVPPTPVPEPSSLALLGLGIAALAAWRRVRGPARG